MIQFSNTGFFGTTDNSNTPSCVVMINGVVQPITVIGYDMAANSMAGFAEGVNLNAGTTISVQVKRKFKKVVSKFKLRGHSI